MKRYIKSVKDYGGAYDIDPQALFSGEEIRDLAYEVCDIVNSYFGSHFDIYDVAYYSETNKISITLMDEMGYEYGAEVKIDLRKFRNHFNLTEAYASVFADIIKNNILRDGSYKQINL